MNFEKRVVGIAVSQEGEPIYSELTTHVRIADESGGEYVEVEQSGRNDLGKIAIEPDGTRVLKAATQEDLKYAFEKLGMTEFIEVAEEEKQIDNTKK